MQRINQLFRKNNDTMFTIDVRAPLLRKVTKAVKSASQDESLPPTPSSSQDQTLPPWAKAVKSASQEQVLPPTPTSQAFLPWDVPASPFTGGNYPPRVSSRLANRISRRPQGPRSPRWQIRPPRELPTPPTVAVTWAYPLVTGTGETISCDEDILARTRTQRRGRHTAAVPPRTNRPLVLRRIATAPAEFEPQPKGIGHSLKMLDDLLVEVQGFQADDSLVMDSGCVRDDFSEPINVW
ncbi:hypothetical protein DFJ77DRAFT_472937 [Powellomyces hirtus]|nr:hypothetical protein DFJ77DRAFT_472937 [Powellomyces hirtus]